jgi:hypothetical protein
LKRSVEQRRELFPLVPRQNVIRCEMRAALNR